ncbi:MAG: TetR/AcrR family transcriptional regulator [Chloroflexota bacterium]|jgi:AcrR family transcriptional regulator
MSMNLQVEEKIDPRVKRTRALIQRAFIDLLEEQGFQSITVQDITQRAEVNRATFYAHFPDKFALLEDTIQHIFRQELEKRTLNACHYSQGNLHALIVTVCEFISQSNRHCKSSDSQFEMLVEKQVRKQIYGLLEMWLVQRNTQGDLKTAATAASWTIYGLAEQWSRDRGTQALTAEQFAKQVLPLVAGNLQLEAV